MKSNKPITETHKTGTESWRIFVSNQSDYLAANSERVGVKIIGLP